MRLTGKLRGEVEKTGLRKVYDEIDLPLVPVLACMEEAGVKLDCDVLAAMSQRLEREINSKAREIYDKSGFEFNINSPKQLGDVLFNKLNLPKPFKYGKGKTIDCGGRAGRAGWRARSPAHGAGLPPVAFEAEVNLRGRAAGAGQLVHPAVAHHLQHGRLGHRTSVVRESQPAKHSASTWFTPFRRP